MVPGSLSLSLKMPLPFSGGRLRRLRGVDVQGVHVKYAGVGIVDDGEILRDGIGRLHVDAPAALNDCTSR